MRALRKTRLKKMWPKFFGPALKKVIFGPQAMETAAPWKPWKTNCMFSTVPTALGKLGKLRSSFPQFPQPLMLDIVLKKKETMPSRRPKQNRVDKMQSKA